MGSAPELLTVDSVQEALDLVGRDLGPSRWFEIAQDRDDAFARSVEDWHWAHNDPARAAAGPFGAPIGHAHLTLSLIPHLFATLLAFSHGECMFYGYNRVRFPAVVPMGARVRLHAHVATVEELDGAEQMTVDLRVEVEDQGRPCCVAESLWRHYSLADAH